MADPMPILGWTPLRYDRGPLQRYELTWIAEDREVEYVDCHQASYPLGLENVGTYLFYAEIRGEWTLMLGAAAVAVKSVRLLGDAPPAVAV